MTHTLHRQGSIESLSDDFLVQVVISKQAETSRKPQNPSVMASVKKATGKSLDRYLGRFPGQKAEIAQILFYLPSPKPFKRFQNRIIRYFVPPLRVFNTKPEFTENLRQLKKLRPGIICRGFRSI